MADVFLQVLYFLKGLGIDTNGIVNAIEKIDSEYSTQMC